MTQTTKRELIIDGLAGMPINESAELNKLKSELYDKHGNPIEFETEQETQESIQKANRFCQLLQKRNGLWLATLN